MIVIVINCYFKVVKCYLYVKFFFGRKMIYFVIVFCWFVLVVVNILQFYGWGKIDYYVLFIDCICVWSLEDKFYIIFFCFMIIFIFVIIIFSCYFVIYRIVWDSVCCVQGYFFLLNVIKIEDKIENKVLKIFLVVVCVYMVCWIFFFVIGFKEVFVLLSV